LKGTIEEPVFPDKEGLAIAKNTVRQALVGNDPFNDMSNEYECQGFHASQLSETSD
jgi:hypothetical protein